MRLNSKVTGGLAWAGLILVLAVPSADMLTRPSANSASVSSTADVTETASIAPQAKPAVGAAKPAAPAVRPVAVAAKPASEDAVETFIRSGKKLPSYISDAPVPTEQALAPVGTEPLVIPRGTAAGAVASDDDKVMNLALVAPEPYPASMRPGSGTTAATAALPADEAPLIVDENDVARREATLRAVEPVLEGEPQVVGDDELQEWDSGSLADYLERKGLISEAEQVEPADSDYDPDGYFLSDGPNDRRSKARLIRRLRDDEVDFLLF